LALIKNEEKECEGGKMFLGAVKANGKRWCYFEAQSGGIIIEIDEA
jgi:hypothetical protein